MRQSLGIWPLKNLPSGRYEDAELFTPIDGGNVDDFETKWKPLLENRQNNLRSGETTADAQVQDTHWEWEKKAKVAESSADYKTYAVECDDITQGLMFLKTIASAREPTQLGQFAVYIHLIATAPWNRHGFSDKKNYKGVGPLLLSTAVSLSKNLGYGGRISLHSLPQSESWYRGNSCLTDLGPDMQHPNKLCYFEMTAEQATKYLK